MTLEQFEELGHYPKRVIVKWGNKTMRITSVDHRAKIVYLTPTDRNVFRPYPAEYQYVEIIDNK